MMTDRAFSLVIALSSVVALGCNDSSAPTPPPGPVTVPAFVFVSDSGGYSNLVRWRNDSLTTLSSGANNSDPNSVGTRIVYTSNAAGSTHIFIADLALATPHQVTYGNVYDRSAVLSPAGDSIAFVSLRSGVPRIWLVNAPPLNQATFDTPTALATGSAAFTPEDGPAWSPAGGLIAFTSVASGTSQVYVVVSGGGTPQQVTNESGGAFQPTWSADGAAIYYLAASPSLVLRKIAVSGTGARTVASDSLNIGAPASCSSALCLYAEDPTGVGGFMQALPTSGAAAQRVFARTAAKERQPAILSQ